MWFGNLVTMNWWNNLWLKESFAVFTAHFCMSKIQPKMSTPIGDIWCGFNRRKQGGYIADEKATTHPLLV
jgi:aminopeptidase N